MAEIPNKIEKFTDLQKDFGTSIAQSLWLKVGQLQNYINDSYPIGMLLFMVNSQDELPATPDLNYWKFCDGTVISNANSPMNGQAVPDFRNRFWRHQQTGEILLSVAGNDSLNFAHNHGGVSSSDPWFGTIDMDTGGERALPIPHSHPIASALGVTSMVPPYFAVQVYVRVA